VCVYKTKGTHGTSHLIASARDINSDAEASGFTQVIWAASSTSSTACLDLAGSRGMLIRRRELSTSAILSLLLQEPREEDEEEEG
jgi:hypothetical protein